MTDPAWAGDYVDLRTTFLDDDVSARLYREYPDTPHNHKQCTTCNGTRRYRFGGVDHDCDCELQVQLHKHYLVSGIGDLYQRLTWGDYQGDSKALQNVSQYLEAHFGMIRSGIGMIFTGEFGVGKTLLMSLSAKELVKLGYDVFFTTFESMVRMFTSGWSSREDKAEFERRIIAARVLFIDDLGREIKMNERLPVGLFDHVIRQRVIDARPTFITTNLSTEQIAVGYNAAIMSLLTERSVFIEIPGADWRPQARNRSVTEALNGERRPVV